jgi:putative addiction module component (TIGR02574 family)
MDSILQQIEKLSVAERLQIIVQVWDGIRSADAEFVLQPWHEAETRRRLEALNLNSTQTLSRDEVWRQVDSANG